MITTIGTRLVRLVRLARPIRPPAFLFLFFFFWDFSAIILVTWISFTHAEQLFFFCLLFCAPLIFHFSPSHTTYINIHDSLDTTCPNFTCSQFSLALNFHLLSGIGTEISPVSLPLL